MKVYNLSASDDDPCIVVKFKTCTIMLDCALNMSSLYNFLPDSFVHKNTSYPKWKLKDDHGYLVTDEELKECSGKVFVDSSPEFCLPETDLLDLSTVDAILISNSASMSALPYITEYFGFQGVIYATEPTHQIGRVIMEELVEYCQTSSKLQHANKWKQRKLKKQLPSSLQHCWNQGLTSWRHCYSLDDLQSSLSRVHIVRYAEKVSIFGALHVTPYSSGFSMGSCNWLIESEFEKITYLSKSSSLMTHSQPLDSRFLSNSNLLIFTGLTQAPTSIPNNMVSEFWSCLAKTVKNGGNVLIPCLPSGLLYDLLDCLLQRMEQSNLINIPINVVSPSAKASLALSQIYAEWLSTDRQQKAYLPEPPFPHDELVQLGRLKVFSSVHDGLSVGFKKPCITFVGHPSLRFGDAVHFIKMWGKSPNNCIIFVEPTFSYLDALSPFQPIAARVYHFPIDTRTNHLAAGRLIDELTPKRVVVPSSYLKPPLSAPHRTDLVLNTKCPLIELQRSTILNLNIKRKLEKADMEPELASSLLPTEINGSLMAPVSAQIVTRNNRHVLKAIYKRTTVGRKRKLHEEVVHRPLSCGKLNVDSFVESLKKEGMTDVKVEESEGSGKIILLQDTVIQIEEGSTHIVCEGNDSLRVKLRDIMLKNLNVT